MSISTKRPRIAFLTSGDPRDRRSWSGIDFYMARALQEHVGDVAYLGDLTPGIRLSLGKVLNKLSETILNRRYAYLHSMLLAKGYAQAVDTRLRENDIDVIFVPSDSTVAALIETKLPMVYLSGATFALMNSYYPQYSNLLAKSVKEGNKLEQLTISKAGLLLYASEWAAQSSMKDYGADRSRIHVLPYGANLEKEDLPTREEVYRKRRSDRCRLLFMGVDWERKGGRIAFDTLVELENRGVPAELIVCGCTPPARFAHKRMRTIPFLSKSDASDRRRLAELYLESDFLLLPTRGECFGVVFCEASAFGLPIITTNTGGVGGAVTEGENGFMLSPEAGGWEYAELIQRLLESEGIYSAVVKSSRAAFEDRLNWDAWGRRVAGLLDGITGSR